MTTLRITEAQADEVVNLLGLAGQVDEGEIGEYGYVYQLENGNTLTVQFEGFAWVMNGDDSRVYGIASEQSGPVSVRYWNGDKYLGEIAFAEERDPDACPGCGWVPGDGLNPNCSHPYGCGYLRQVGAEEIAREQAACAAEGLSY